MSDPKNPLNVQTLDMTNHEEMTRFEDAWIAASLADTIPVLAEMVKAGIIDEHGRRVSTLVPPDMLNPAANGSIRRLSVLHNPR